MPYDAAAAPGETAAIDAFIARWNGTGLAERANYVSFLNEFCALLGLPLPEPAASPGDPYRYERPVIHHAADGTTTTRRIDLYRRGHFVLEAKQGANPRPQARLFEEAERRANIRHSPRWMQEMLKAKGQAEGYAHDLPPEEG